MITASVHYCGQHLSDLTVLNPGNWFGKTWMIEIGGSYVPFLAIVEADTESDAIDVFSDSKYGFHIHVEESDLDDYPEDDRRYDGSGRVIDLDNFGIYDLDRESVKYHGSEDGHDLPADGIPPKDLADWRNADYELIVGNIGSFHLGRNVDKANKDFDEYVEISKNTDGHRAFGEDVTLLNGPDIVREHLGWISVSNYIRESYENGDCPDCGENIPFDVADGQACENCHHVFVLPKVLE